MEDIILRVINAFKNPIKPSKPHAQPKPKSTRPYKRRLMKIVKRRSPAARLKARIYYRKNRNKIRLSRRRYRTRTKLFMKSRKMFNRSKPSWLTQSVNKTLHTKPSHAPKPKGFHKAMHNLLNPGKKAPSTAKPKTMGIKYKWKANVPRRSF